MTPPRYDFRTAPLAIDLYCGLGGWTSGQKSKVLALFNALSAADVRESPTVEVEDNG